MKIGLLGYGKMGKAIDQIAGSQGLDIVWRFGSGDLADISPERLQEAEVIIEFTRPEAAFANVMLCLEAGVPVVSGTTGWLEKLPEAQAFCLNRGGALIWASNFSIGVNLFFALNKYLSALMAARPEYQASLTEIHHIHKLDAPSGTALTLVKDLLSVATRYRDWAPGQEGMDPEILPINSIREAEIPGTHQVYWKSDIDEIQIAHVAHSRAGFAAGALVAAKWLLGKKGCFNMSDVLGL